MPYHHTLESQIKKTLQDTHLADNAVLSLLDIISRTYDTYEKDKKLTEHAFEVSEREYQEANNDLKKQNEIRIASIKKIKAAIRSLDTYAVVEDDTNDLDLMDTIAFLEKQIQKSKILENELIQAVELTEKALKAKTEFLSVMSHEIRTPLNAIIGTILLLKYKELNEEQQELLKVMEISSENLLSLINDVLDFNKLEEGKIIFAEREIDIHQYIKNVKKAHSIRAEEKQNSLKIMFDDDIPQYIVGDDMRLGQILNNLVSNAIKFTFKGIITLAVSLVEQDQDWVTLHFKVSDSGIGISKEKQAIIFDSFTQANANITREYGGSGLGLTIIKKLLELQGSKINVESETGKGSSFYFDLTFKKSKQLAQKKVEEKSPEDERDLQGIRILLVEDVAFNVMVAERLLKKWNAVVTVANNGLEAVGLVKLENFDVILMDIHMPIMDGYTATQEIRAFNTEIPIIALTASSSIHEQSNIVGMNGFIAKPFNVNELYTTLHRFTYPN